MAARARQGRQLGRFNDLADEAHYAGHIRDSLDARDGRPAERRLLTSRLSATGHGGQEVSPTTLARSAALDAPSGIDFYGSFDDSD